MPQPWNPVGERRAHSFANFVTDADRVLADIDRRFGPKPKIGIFHSLAALTALQQAIRGDAFAALMLFDPPICKPGVFPEHLVEVGTQLGGIAGRRRFQFQSPEQYAENLAGKPVFERLTPTVVDLFARTTLRHAAAGMHELCCPREYEAQIYNYIFCWAIALDLDAVNCPMNVIGADPTTPNSFMPSADSSDLVAVYYDFIPDSTPLLLLEEPELCARLTREFMANCGYA